MAGHHTTLQCLPHAREWDLLPTGSRRRSFVLLSKIGPESTDGTSPGRAVASGRWRADSEDLRTNEVQGIGNERG